MGDQLAIRYNPLTRGPLYHAGFTFALRITEEASRSLYTDDTRDPDVCRAATPSHPRRITAAQGSAPGSSARGLGRRRARASFAKSHSTTRSRARTGRAAAADRGSRDVRALRSGVARPCWRDAH